DLEPERTLVQIRQVVSAHQGAKNPNADERHSRRQIGNDGSSEQTSQRGPVAPSQPFERSVAKRPTRLAKRQIGKPGNERERAQKRAEQPKADRISHRRKERRLAALQREQREVGGDDDQGRKKNRPRDLARR